VQFVRKHNGRHLLEPVVVQTGELLPEEEVGKLGASPNGKATDAIDRRSARGGSLLAHGIVRQPNHSAASGDVFRRQDVADDSVT
jgi:hypothetical protein